MKRRHLPITTAPAPRFSADTIAALRRRSRAAGYTLRCQGSKVLLLRFGASTEIESLAHVNLLLGDAP